MKHLAAALALVLALAFPLNASANKTWDRVKEEWGYRPWAVILAIPAFIVTMPFMAAKGLMDAMKSHDDGDEDEDEE